MSTSFQIWEMNRNNSIHSKRRINAATVCKVDYWLPTSWMSYLPSLNASITISVDRSHRNYLLPYRGDSSWNISYQTVKHCYRQGKVIELCAVLIVIKRILTNWILLMLDLWKKKRSEYTVYGKFSYRILRRFWSKFNFRFYNPPIRSLYRYYISTYIRSIIICYIDIYNNGAVSRIFRIHDILINFQFTRVALVVLYVVTARNVCLLLCMNFNCIDIFF